MSTPRISGWFLVFLYALSGLTGLAYEVLWARMLALQFGVSIFGVIVSVAAFMAGLGLGSILGARHGQRAANPLRVFAWLEIGVALYALLSPGLLKLSDAWLGGIAPHVDVWTWYALQGTAALFWLLIPATAMGAGFALVLRAVSPARIGLNVIYGVNATGGALGALLPLWLLPAFGWVNAMGIVAGLGLLVGGAVWLLARQSWAVQPVVGAREFKRPAGLPLLAYTGVGAAALLLEIGWTRLFGMILLRTEYVLAVILAVFVLGLGLGSLLARRARAAWWLTLLPFVAGVFALLSLWLLPWVSAWAEQARYTGLFSAMLWQGAVLAAVTLPVTLILGAWLPLLAARHTASNAGAWLYGANSLGAALGTVTAGAVGLPWLGATGTVCAAAVLLFLFGVACYLPRRIWIVTSVGLAGLLALAWPVYELPDVARLLPATQANARDLYRHEDALTITHVVERADGQRVLLTDLQRMDAASDQAAVAVQENQARLPLLLHPAPRSVLFLGLGTGISAAGAQPFPNLARNAVELSQGALTAAATWFAPVNGGVLQRMHVARDDARRFLRADEQRYDVIIGDLFHPDLAGHSALLTVQQFARARARLTDGGLFVQWLALNQFDAESLATVLRTFQRVFPEAVVFMDGLRLALVGPRDRFFGAPALFANLRRLDADAQRAATGGEGAWTWLGRYWGKIAAGDGPLQDEWAPRIEYQLPRARYQGDFDLTLLLTRLLQGRPTMEQAAQALDVTNADMPAFERAYSATELAVRGWQATLQGSDEGARLMRLAYQANPQDRWVGFSLADSMLATLPQAVRRGMDERKALQTILEIRPDHAEALRALWHLERAAGDARAAEMYRARLQAVSPLDKEIRADF